MSRPEPPRVLFLGMTYLGWAPRFRSLVANTCNDPRIRPTYAPITGWQQGGCIEWLPLPETLKGRARTLLEAAPFAKLPRPDVIWTSAPAPLLPYLWAQLGPLHRPVVLELDWTFEQQEAWAGPYFGRRPKHGLRRAAARLADRAVRGQISLFTPVSEWAAGGLCRAGVPDERIEVRPAGVDLDGWKPHWAADAGEERPLRLLFVGGDFHRKGGDLALESVRRHGGAIELDVVTRDENVRPEPWVRVHRAEPGSPLLRELFARADVFVMPSRAECYGFATIEALASGLPVVVGAVGGAASIVDEGETGWLVEPTAEAVHAALADLLRQRERLPAMGHRARAVAVERFDGRRNDAGLVGRLLELAGERSR